MQAALAALLDGGTRLHLQHGPIDLIVGADGRHDRDRHAAFAAATARFAPLLEGLVAELPRHRSPLTEATEEPADPVARRMYRAARPFCRARFVTPMIAVAGAVADAILAAMVAAAPLRRAYVNNGGDIAVHLVGEAEFSVKIGALDGRDLGRVRLRGSDGVGGLATSGAGGRSHSFGIADGVTAVAASAASADVAATLIANAVDLPGHPGIGRTAAADLQPDSDLGHRRVVTHIPKLSPGEAARALARGERCGRQMVADGHICGAALFLQGETVMIGRSFTIACQALESAHA